MLKYLLKYYPTIIVIVCTILVYLSVASGSGKPPGIFLYVMQAVIWVGIAYLCFREQVKIVKATRG